MPSVRSVTLLACAVVLVAGLFVLGAQPFAVGLVPPPWDKLAHAVLFGALFLIADRAVRWPLPAALALPLLISAADELHQLVLPGRHASWTDWLAGVAGVLTAALLRDPRSR